VRSWVESANRPGCDFPLENLPYGVFRTVGRAPRVGVAIGDFILDAAACGFPHTLSTLNDLLRLGPEEWTRLRGLLSAFLREDAEPHPEALVPMAEAELLLPAEIGDYTDFYASVFHATNVGRMFRPDQPLMPNYKHVPIAYHGRASSLVASGTPVRRPSGQLMDAGATGPRFGLSQQMDYELEMGILIGTENRLGEPIPIAEAARHIFGFCLVNDWSARDIQRWEYQPLGPFLGKSFATSVSPWVVTAEALAPYRAQAFQRESGDPAPLEYLWDADDQAHGGLDVTLEVLLASSRMRREGIAPVRMSLGNARDLYWTPAQMVAHHASNGCNLRPGDLLATGTVSGRREESRGCLLERAWRGTKPVELPTGEARAFLEDGDEVILRGWCEREGLPRIGFGECRGVVSGARQDPTWRQTDGREG
jgi:fumarylacetoacetase